MIGQVTKGLCLQGCAFVLPLDPWWVYMDDLTKVQYCVVVFEDVGRVRIR